ncbi:MAG: type I methionyl aminopeptidase [Planctomycetota bacterium]
MIHLKTPAEIELLAQAGRVLADTFREVAPWVRPGVSTGELDSRVRECLVARGGEPLFFDYDGFPGNSCISVNDEVVHGIPGRRVLADGDIVTVDIGVRLAGFCADAAETFLVGEVSERARRLVDCCRGALAAGIAACRPGGRISDVSRAVETHTRAGGFFVVTTYVGHGIGREMHEDPPVPNFVAARPFEDPVLEPGLVIAIEPMVTETSERVRTLADGWTVATVDGGLSCHCEHTVAVTDAGPRVLTLAPDSAGVAV